MLETIAYVHWKVAARLQQHWRCRRESQEENKPVGIGAAKGDGVGAGAALVMAGWLGSRGESRGSSVEAATAACAQGSSHCGSALVLILIGAHAKCQAQACLLIGGMQATELFSHGDCMHACMKVYDPLPTFVLVHHCTAGHAAWGAEQDFN